ncbi:hypothetical protein [Lentilactobacillus senioris]|uniref:hypothetical protein n=1 Tax=Lentilactobacillus senioris TaxID=931534 RepID=UPI003D2A9A3C
MSYYNMQNYSFAGISSISENEELVSIFGKNTQRCFYFIWGIISEGINHFGALHGLTIEQKEIDYPLNFYVLYNVGDKARIYFSSDKAIRGISTVYFDGSAKQEQNRIKLMSGINFINYVDVNTIDIQDISNIITQSTDNDLTNNEWIINKNKQLYLNIYKTAIYTTLRMVKENNTMQFNPIFKARDLTIDDKMVFGILQFDDDRLEFFDSFIKPIIEDEFNLNVIKSGDIFDASSPNIMENIWVYINTSKFIICDLSGKNPNVFYELGIANTIGKPVITICDAESFEKDYGSKLPFDISSNTTIFYKNTAVGAEIFKVDLKATIKSVITGQPVIKKMS